MKKVVIFALFALIAINLNLPAIAQQGDQKVVLFGGVQENVPKTPDEVKAYLLKMKAIMSEYDTLSNQLMMIVMSGSPSVDQANTARGEWIRLANKIDGIVPPSELTTSHKTLASSLRRSSTFLQSIAGAGPEQKTQVLTSMMPVVTDLMNAANSYSSGVSVIISQKGLDPSLNPLGASGSLNPGILSIPGLGF